MHRNKIKMATLVIRRQSGIDVVRLLNWLVLAPSTHHVQLLSMFEREIYIKMARPGEICLLLLFFKALSPVEGRLVKGFP